MKKGNEAEGCSVRLGWRRIREEWGANALKVPFYGFFLLSPLTFPLFPPIGALYNYYANEIQRYVVKTLAGNVSQHLKNSRRAGQRGEISYSYRCRFLSAPFLPLMTYLSTAIHAGERASLFRMMRKYQRNYFDFVTGISSLSSQSSSVCRPIELLQANFVVFASSKLSYFCLSLLAALTVRCKPHCGDFKKAFVVSFTSAVRSINSCSSKFIQLTQSLVVLP